MFAFFVEAADYGRAERDEKARRSRVARYNLDAIDFGVRVRQGFEQRFGRRQIAASDQKAIHRSRVVAHTNQHIRVEVDRF